MNYKRLFYNWLQKEDIHNQFFSNVVTANHVIHKSNSGKKVFEYIVKIVGKHPRNYMSTFVWEDTYQGYHFWSEKHFKWAEYLRQWKSAH